MFLDWFGTKDSGELQLFSVGRSAWEALDYIPILLLIAIIVALGALVLRMSGAPFPFPVALGALVAVLGTASALSILFRIIEPPDFGSFREVWGVIAIEGTVKPPMFVALAAATGIALGGLLMLLEYR